MMTHNQMLKRAERWLLDAEEDNGDMEKRYIALSDALVRLADAEDNGDMEKRYIALSDALVRLAEEVRKGSAPGTKEIKP